MQSYTELDAKYSQVAIYVRQHMFCPDRQQYNNTKPFPVFVVATEDLEVQNYYECFK